MAASNSSINDQLHWYKDAVIYELHIKAFRDGNKDGIGDFQGLLSKLDYLQELGVTAIWLLPFYPSPLKDDGYDIADYYTINPRYGTIEEFQQLLEEAHKRNLKVITELVINHTSDQHPWFQRARQAPKDSTERAYYVWTDNPEQYKDVRIIFQDFETSNWTWDPVAQQYYWHRFFHHQPDLNYDNLQVQEEIFRIIDFWCAMGVDGFRLDAVPYLYEREGTNGENLPETHAFLKKLRKHIDQKFPGVAFLAEANMWPEDSASYFGEGDECHMNYHFPVMPRMFMALQQEDRYPITDIFDQTPPIPETCQWAIFLRNHDELTLEMVTDEERDFMYKVYAKDPKAKINLGIRHRLAPLMDNNRSRIELMNSLLFSLPGTPVIYYGDEIGMGDNFYLGDRDGVRTPMQWSPDRNAGFSETNPQQLYLPVILDPEYHYEAVNVETQRRNTSSLFWFMKSMINTRKKFQAFSRGDMQFLPVENSKVLAFTRTYGDETILVIANLSKYAQPAEIDLRHFQGYIPIEIFSKNHFPMIRNDQPYFFTLGPHSFQWFNLQKIRTHKDDVADFPKLNIQSVEELLVQENRWHLENEVLLQYLPKRKWFKGQDRKIYAIQVKHTATIRMHTKPVLFMIAEVQYESGLPEWYQLALTNVSGEEAQKIAHGCPESVLAMMAQGTNDALLCDAFYLHEFHVYLLQEMSNEKNDPKKMLFADIKEDVRNVIGDRQLLTRMHGQDENNTSIQIDNRYFLKMYRKLDLNTNPDVEVSRYLSDTINFEHVPRFLGTINWEVEGGNLVLGMLQELIENHGNGHGYMLERVNNYLERIMARDRDSLLHIELVGNLTHPAAFEELSPEWQVLIGNRSAGQAGLIGKRTAEMHLALSAAKDNAEFKPEEYSLHYQRSLFSSLQALVRESFQRLEKNMEHLPHDIRQQMSGIPGRKENLLHILRRIYSKKLDIWKIRIHGSFRLEKLLMTGKDIVIQDFGGNAHRSFSERRIRRSPMRDVAEIITSFYYVAYEAFFASNHIQKDELEKLLPFAEKWAFYMSSFFLKAYNEQVEGTALIPEDKNDYAVVLETFLMEKALVHLNEELNQRQEWAIVPLRMIRSMLMIKEPEAVVEQM